MNPEIANGRRGEQALCSAVSRSAGEQPIGTAAAHDSYLLLETPLPWAREALDSMHVPDGVREAVRNAVAQGRDVRFLAFMSETNPSPAGFRRVIHYRKPAGAFAEYEKEEYVVSENDLPALAESIALDAGRPDEFASCRAETARTRDLFVCTHGSRDVCCGSLGHPIYELAERMYAAPSGGALRVWRVSHLGGHRFAPTLADFPEARYWAYVEPGDLANIVRRSGAFSEVAGKYRGWGGVGKIEQVLEREALLREGWGWTALRKSGSAVRQDDGTYRVRIAAETEDGAPAGVYEGVVELAGTVMTGGCTAEPKEVPQYRARMTVPEESRTHFRHIRDL